MISPDRSALQLTRDEARELAVIATGLDRRPDQRRIDSADILATIRALGMIQLDTISVISRSHETVLWSRLGRYDRSLISELYDPGFAITEYLAHAAAIIPSEMLPLFRRHMKTERRYSGWASDPAHREVMDRVIDHIAQHGPSASRHFERPKHNQQTKPWDWYGPKPERWAMEALWVRGETILRRRDQGFHRVFDLPDRIYPGFWDGELLPDEERNRQFARIALSALGVVTAGWLSDYFRASGTSYLPVAVARRLLAEMERDGDAIRVQAPGIDEEMWMNIGLSQSLDDLRAGHSQPTLTTLLSPFDNLIWERDRGERLFDFRYRLECYTPAPKRQYGYYSLPILHQGQIVGRLDPSYNRRNRFLTVKILHLEPWVRPSETIGKAIAQALDDLVSFLGGETGAWELLAANPPQILPFVRS